MHHHSGKRTAPPRVLIAGGGIGGLCLAQGLVKSGIDVTVYERDDSARFRRQGYRVSLREHGPRVLRDCLPADLFDLCVATSLRPATRMAFLDDQLGEKFAKPTGHADTGPDDAALGVNRLTLREILLARLGDAVHFGKAFERYERLAGGRVRAHFADGTTATGDLLVGADGTNSAVRRLLLPAAGIDELDTAIYGRTPLTAGVRRWLPEVLVDSFTRILGSSGTAMALTTCRTWAPVADAAARIAPDVRLTDVPDYVSWTLSPVDPAPVDPEGAPLHRRARTGRRLAPRAAADRRRGRRRGHLPVRDQRSDPGGAVAGGERDPAGRRDPHHDARPRRGRQHRAARRRPAPRRARRRRGRAPPAGRRGRALPGGDAALRFPGRGRLARPAVRPATSDPMTASARTCGVAAPYAAPPWRLY